MNWFQRMVRLPLKQDYPRINALSTPIVEVPKMSFLAKFKTDFEKLFHVAPTWVHTGQSVVAFATPIVLAIVAQFDPAAATVAGPIVSEIQSDLATASVLVGDGTATVSLSNALANVQTNMTALLAAGHVKDATIQADVQLVVSELAAFAKELPGVGASTVLPTPPLSVPTIS